MIRSPPRDRASRTVREPWTSNWLDASIPAASRCAATRRRLGEHPYILVAIRLPHLFLFLIISIYLYFVVPLSLLLQLMQYTVIATVLPRKSGSGRVRGCRCAQEEGFGRTSYSAFAPREPSTLDPQIHGTCAGRSHAPNQSPQRPCKRIPANREAVGWGACRALVLTTVHPPERHPSYIRRSDEASCQLFGHRSGLRASGRAPAAASCSSNDRPAAMAWWRERVVAPVRRAWLAVARRARNGGKLTANLISLSVLATIAMDRFHVSVFISRAIYAQPFRLGSWSRVQGLQFLNWDACVVAACALCNSWSYMQVP
jgi:hypothetical protein